MRRLPSILVPVAAVLWLTSAIAGAQSTRVDESARQAAREKNRREMAARAQQRRLLELSNQLRPFYRYELMHVRSACGLSREKMREIRPEADASYERAIVDLDRARQSRGDDVDYRKAIDEAVHAVVDRHVGRDQWGALQAELRLRAASGMEAAVEMLVAELDRELLLTEPQRRDLIGVLSSRWEDRWADAVEVAFDGPYRRPGIPDEFMASILSAAQLEAWRELPPQPGRLWSVVVDQGGGPDVEKELGAGEATGRNFLRPHAGFEAPGAPFVRLHEVTGRHGALPDVVQWRVAADQRAVRAPAAVIRRAEIPQAAVDPDAEEDAVEKRERERLERLKAQERRFITSIDRSVLQAADEPAARRRFECALARRVDYLSRAGGLAEGPCKKLRAAGHGDIKRFLDHYLEVRDATSKDLLEGNRGRLLALDIQPFIAEREALAAVAGPIFGRTLRGILTDAHRASIEEDARDRLAFRHRAGVRWTAFLLARSLGLTDDRRRRLEAVLLEQTRPARNHAGFERLNIMEQAAGIPEADLRPIFDDLQWGIVEREREVAHTEGGWRRRRGDVPFRFHVD